MFRALTIVAVVDALNLVVYDYMTVNKNTDKKILWAIGTSAFSLVVLVVCLAAALTTEGFQNWKVLLPICFMLIAMLTSMSVLLFIIKSGCKKT